MSPRGVLNLSRKLTLRWTGPYRVTNTPSESLFVIDPIGGWAINKRELHVLTNRLKRIDPKYSRLVSEQVDLDQLTHGEAENEEVRIPAQGNPTYSNLASKRSGGPEDIFPDSSEDKIEYPPARSQETSQPLQPQDSIEPLILKPSMIKMEVNPEVNLPQTEAILGDNPLQPPAGKRKYTRRDLPPPPEGQGGARRAAFYKEMKHIQDNLHKRK